MTKNSIKIQPYNHAEHADATPQKTSAGTKKEGQKTPPDNIVTAVRLWYLTAVFQIVHFVLVAMMTLENTAPLYKQIEESGVSVPEGISLDDILPAVVVTRTILAIIVALFFVFLASRIQKGSGVARNFIMIASIFLYLQAITVLFGDASSTASQGLYLADGIMVILSAVATATAVYFSGREDSKKYLGFPSRAELLKQQKEFQEKYLAEKEEAQRQRKAKKAVKEAKKEGAKKKDTE